MDQVYSKTKLVTFINKSSESFTHTIGGEPMTFEPNVPCKLTENVARLMSWHLALREIRKEGTEPDNALIEARQNDYVIGEEEVGNYSAQKVASDEVAKLQKQVEELQKLVETKVVEKKKPGRKPMIKV